MKPIKGAKKWDGSKADKAKDKKMGWKENSKADKKADSMAQKKLNAKAKKKNKK